MPGRTAIDVVDQRVNAVLRRNPRIGASGAMAMIFQADPDLYERYRREMLEISAVLGGRDRALELVTGGSEKT